MGIRSIIVFCISRGQISVVLELVAKLKEITTNYKTLYIMGCFAAPMNYANKTRYCNNHSYNQKSARLTMLKAASADTFGFDCVNLIKGVLWGWCGDASKNYSGAKYAVIGVYIGNGLAIECTPSWKNCVQITACNCNVAGYNRRDWTKHGKLPYITYQKAKKQLL